MKMIFAYDSLRDFFQHLKKLGPTELFKDWDGSKCFLLRHDVDFDIGPAYELAKIEAQEGVRSTFFILTTCRTYNVLQADNRERLRNITRLGHEVGLHFDPTLYGKADLQDAVEKETEVLSFALGKKVRSISLHNPSIHNQYPLFDGYVNAYDPSLFSDENYISDSCYSFRNKDPFEFVKGINKQMVQILLHPIHYSNQGDGYKGVIIRSLERHMNEVHEEFLSNHTYREEIEGDLVNAFRRDSK